MNHLLSPDTFLQTDDIQKKFNFKLQFSLIKVVKSSHIIVQWSLLVFNQIFTPFELISIKWFQILLNQQIRYCCCKLMKWCFSGPGLYISKRCEIPCNMSKYGRCVVHSRSFSCFGQVQCYVPNFSWIIQMSFEECRRQINTCKFSGWDIFFCSDILSKL